MDFDTIEGKDNKNGLSFDPVTCQVKTLGLIINCKIPKDKSVKYKQTHPNELTTHDYIKEALKNFFIFNDRNSIKVISKNNKLTESNAKTTLSRIRNQLKKFLDERGVEI